MLRVTAGRLCLILAMSSLALAPSLLSAKGVKAAKDARVYFISPADGETVSGPFICRFGLRNMGVTHAGDDFAGSGHHHLLIDVDETMQAGEPIPRDKKHIHYAAGETEARIELPPGKHTLQLVLGDTKHLNFDPPLVSEKIMITVGKSNGSDEARATRSTNERRRILERAAAPEPLQLQPAVTPEMTKSPESSDFISRVFTGSK
ncbi:hypothetical protein SSBR45G_50030 [Bradyrhizobium sp. SSBR45G]|uniref:DUF4399 domain-containing protein n=1 Tax=unclassified Bradyrhizobium TaxID=2631580 RepID=UPI0023429D9D|nr:MULTISPECIES: DUF4399 domain-containing protein [unclassified Bradyrhizobium]GLH80094.1 hypothetical protein SSBR45G_50030 [Bradyrhizobium sp. SSBR45G]GLH87597.1 hypothetical protein SSBR45R_50570 [Bradyrhizobium sp. SSBR45R]